jgi:hypothetical protein
MSGLPPKADIGLLTLPIALSSSATAGAKLADRHLASRVCCIDDDRQLRQPYSGRRDPLVKSNRSGSFTSQSMQRNLRPPVLTSIKCIGLPHLEHVGGGGFLGINAPLGLGGSAKLSVTDDYQNEAAMIDCAPFFGRLRRNSSATYVCLQLLRQRASTGPALPLPDALRCRSLRSRHARHYHAENRRGQASRAVSGFRPCSNNSETIQTVGCIR